MSRMKMSLVGDFKGEGGLPRPGDRVYQELEQISVEAGIKIKELLVKTAKELFGNDFPKMNFCTLHGGGYEEVSLCGMVVYEPRENDNSRFSVLMLQDGLYIVPEICKDNKGSFKTDTLSPMALWQYSEFARNAVFALQTAYEKKQVKGAPQQTKGVCMLE